MCLFKELVYNTESTVSLTVDIFQLSPSRHTNLAYIVVFGGIKWDFAFSRVSTGKSNGMGLPVMLLQNGPLAGLVLNPSQWF